MLYFVQKKWRQQIMAEKNLHDIKIDELDSPKKTPLKNILTLLALLFIILVISVVITKLILSTDGGKELDENKKNAIVSTEINNDANTTTDTETKEKNTSVAIPVISNIPERNLTSRTKTPLRTHEPVKEVKEVTTKAPTKSKTPKHTTTKAPKHPSATKHSSSPKKEYIDKVVVKKAPKKVTAKAPSYLGGKKQRLSTSYYIQVGSYKNTATILSKVKKQNFNYSLQPVDRESELTRVFVGPFFSQNQAERSLSKVKAHISDKAFVKKVIP